jgi:hypothetical protein
MSFDAHKNFAASTVLTPPSPPSSGLSLTLAAAGATKFPATPFNATVWPAGVGPNSGNAEIIRVTGIAGDVLTILRAQEGTSARTILVGDNIANTITAKVITDIESGAVAPASNPIQQSAGQNGPTDNPPPFIDQPAINIPEDGSTWQDWNPNTHQWR